MSSLDKLRGEPSPYYKLKEKDRNNDGRTLSIEKLFARHLKRKNENK